MKAYPAYKKSGIEWVREIPEHWSKKRLKYISQTQPSNVDKKSKEDEKEVLLCNYVDVYKNEFITDDIAFMKATASDAQIEKFTLKKGDVLVTKDSEDPKDIAVPALVSKNYENVVCGYHLTRIRPLHKLSGRYIFRILQAKPFNTHFEINAKGVTRYGLGTETFLNFITPLPPPKEQTTIANFLDHKTTQIDLSIEKRRELIDLLKEHRAAIINEAVTKGINRDAPMKDSGIEWIGEVPEHWEVKALKWIIREPLKYGANEPALDDNPDNPRYIRITDFGKNGKLRNNTFKSLPPSIAQDYLLQEGDILFARSGATVGKTFQFKGYDGQACYAGYLIKASPHKNEILSDYLYYYTKSGAYENWKSSIFNQATIQNIGADKYKTLPVSLPNIDEQRKIVTYIDRETTRIDDEMQSTQKEIDLLEEYRQSLIAEAVTGKIDVRDYPLN